MYNDMLDLERLLGTCADTFIDDTGLFVSWLSQSNEDIQYWQKQLSYVFTGIHNHSAESRIVDMLAISQSLTTRVRELLSRSITDTNCDFKHKVSAECKQVFYQGVLPQLIQLTLFSQLREFPASFANIIIAQVLFTETQEQFVCAYLQANKKYTRLIHGAGIRTYPNSHVILSNYENTMPQMLHLVRATNFNNAFSTDKCSEHEIDIDIDDIQSPLFRLFSVLDTSIHIWSKEHSYEVGDDTVEDAVSPQELENILNLLDSDDVQVAFDALMHHLSHTKTTEATEHFWNVVNVIEALTRHLTQAYEGDENNILFDIYKKILDLIKNHMQFSSQVIFDVERACSRKSQHVHVTKGSLNFPPTIFCKIFQIYAYIHKNVYNPDHPHWLKAYEYTNKTFQGDSALDTFCRITLVNDIASYAVTRQFFSISPSVLNDSNQRFLSLFRLYNVTDYTDYVNFSDHLDFNTYFDADYYKTLLRLQFSDEGIRETLATLAQCDNWAVTHDIQSFRNNGAINTLLFCGDTFPEKYETRCKKCNTAWLHFLAIFLAFPSSHLFLALPSRLVIRFLTTIQEAQSQTQQEISLRAFIFTLLSRFSHNLTHVKNQDFVDTHYSIRPCSFIADIVCGIRNNISEVQRVITQIAPYDVLAQAVATISDDYQCDNCLSGITERWAQLSETFSIKNNHRQAHQMVYYSNYNKKHFYRQLAQFSPSYNQHRNMLSSGSLNIIDLLGNIASAITIVFPIVKNSPEIQRYLSLLVLQYVFLQPLFGEYKPHDCDTVNSEHLVSAAELEECVRETRIEQFFRSLFNNQQALETIKDTFYNISDEDIIVLHTFHRITKNASEEFNILINSDMLEKTLQRITSDLKKYIDDSAVSQSDFVETAQQNPVESGVETHNTHNDTEISDNRVLVDVLYSIQPELVFLVEDLSEIITNSRAVLNTNDIQLLLHILRNKAGSLEPLDILRLFVELRKKREILSVQEFAEYIRQEHKWLVLLHALDTDLLSICCGIDVFAKQSDLIFLLLIAQDIIWNNNISVSVADTTNNTIQTFTDEQAGEPVEKHTLITTAAIHNGTRTTDEDKNPDEIAVGKIKDKLTWLPFARQISYLINVACPSEQNLYMNYYIIHSNHNVKYFTSRDTLSNRANLRQLSKRGIPDTIINIVSAKQQHMREILQDMLNKIDTREPDTILHNLQNIGHTLQSFTAPNVAASEPTTNQIPYKILQGIFEAIVQTYQNRDKSDAGRHIQTPDTNDCLSNIIARFQSEGERTQRIVKNILQVALLNRSNPATSNNNDWQYYYWSLL